MAEAMVESVDSVAINTVRSLNAKITKKQKEKFMPTVDIHERLELAENLLKRHKLLPNIPMRIPKSNVESMKYSNEGDGFVNDRDTKAALESYNLCIAFAETGSDFLSLGYAKRIEVFFDLKSYDECLRDINLVLNSNYCPANLRTELLKRKEMCEKALEDTSTSSSSSTADWHHDVSLFATLSYPPHPKIPFIANCLDLQDLPEYGRSIVTKSDLHAGAVIAIEKPFAAASYGFMNVIRCSYCLRETYSLIPCPICPTAMFCNQKCLKLAYNKFHKYECNALNYLLEAIPNNRLMSVRVVLQAVSLFKTIDRLISFEKNTKEDTNIFQIDASKLYNEDTDVGIDEETDDVDDDSQDYGAKLTELDYYPMHALSKDIIEPDNLTNDKYFGLAVQTILATHALFECLKDLIKTDEHKRFLRHFVYRQYEVAGLYCHGLDYRVEYLEEDSPTHGSETYGSAIYPFSGLMNHSCAPNVFRTYNGSIVTIVVLRPVKKDEQLFTNYGNIYWSKNKKERQQSLRDDYSFHCKCEACERDFPMVDKLVNSPIPHLPETGKVIATKDLKFMVETIKTFFEYLNKYNINYPCLQILNVELKLKTYFSYFLRHPATKGYTKQ